MIATARLSLELFLLGPFQCAVDGVLVDKERWARPKAKLLVKLLAVQPHSRLHREQIVEQLWPDLAPNAAEKSLDKLVYLARRALEPELATGSASRFIYVADRHVALRSPGVLWIDADVFEQRASSAIQQADVEACESARAVYRGDLLDENPYDAWLLARRERLRGLYAELLSTLARLYEQQRRYRRSIELLRELAEREPFEEGVARRLMRLYALGGNPQQAVVEYRRIGSILERELGVGLEDATIALHDQIASGSLCPPVETVTSPLPRETPNNLPYPMTSFVGRRRELDALKSELASSRLLTLTGPGGIGKTRLAVRIAAEMLDEFPDGAWLVELAPLADPVLVAASVARAVGVQEEPGQPIENTLTEALRERHALIVLDNCEHLVEACAGLVYTLLRDCARLRILATSRETLRVPGETVRPVPLLTLPDPRRLPEIASLADCEAVRLLLDRIAQNDPKFEITEENARRIAELCRRLDGIPLAIEFAAARARVLSIEQIVERLDHQFRVLSSGDRTAPPRHGSLEASMDWSYLLLSRAEKVLLARLSVFASGWTVAAAEDVCGNRGEPERTSTSDRADGAPIDPREGSAVMSEDVVGLLGYLVDKSLVLVERRGGDTRYRMLETIRQYAADRLDESGEARELRARHAAWFLGLAERTNRGRWASDDSELLARLEADHDNLRAALRWYAEDVKDAAACVRFCSALGRFWIVRGHLSEGLSWTQKAIDVPGDQPWEGRAAALKLAGYLMMCCRDTERAKSFVERCLALHLEKGSVAGAAHALRSLGDIVGNQGDAARAAELYRESLALFRAIGDEHGAAGAIYGLGVQAADRGDWEDARAHYEESLDVYRKLGNSVDAATMLSNLGEIACRQGQYDLAVRLLEESHAMASETGYKALMGDTTTHLGSVANERREFDSAVTKFAASIAIHRDLGNRQGLAYAIEGLACTAAARGEAVRALRLAGGAAALRDAIRWALAPSEQAALDRYIVLARQSLGGDRSSEACAEGRRMSLTELLEYATGE